MIAPSVLPKYTQQIIAKEIGRATERKKLCSAFKSLPG